MPVYCLELEVGSEDRSSHSQTKVLLIDLILLALQFSEGKCMSTGLYQKQAPSKGLIWSIAGACRRIIIRTNPSQDTNTQQIRYRYVSRGQVYGTFVVLTSKASIKSRRSRMSWAIVVLPGQCQDDLTHQMTLAILPPGKKADK